MQDKRGGERKGERDDVEAVDVAHGRGNQQADRREQQHLRLDAGVARVELLRVVLEAAQQEGRAEGEEAVAHDRAGQRRLHQVEHSRPQGRDADDELGHVAEGGVQESAHRVPGLRRDALGRPGKQGGQGDDRADREQEERRVGLGPGLLGEQDDRARRRGASSAGCPGDPSGSGSSDASFSRGQFRRNDRATLRISLAAKGVELHAIVGPWTRMSMIPALKATPMREPAWK